MKKVLISGIIVAIILMFILIINLIYPLELNDKLNSAFNPLNKVCNSNVDCTKLDTNCRVHCGFECVNKNWKPFCPLPEIQIACSLIWDQNIDCKCVDNVCKKYNVLTNEIE